MYNYDIVKYYYIMIITLSSMREFRNMTLTKLDKIAYVNYKKIY